MGRGRMATWKDFFLFGSMAFCSIFAPLGLFYFLREVRNYLKDKKPNRGRQRIGRCGNKY